MCSVSVYRSNGLFLVTMNRDERRERHEAGLCVDDQCCYPVDGLAGGTWFGVNRQGLVAALLNRYQDEPSAEVTLSRGSIIPQLLLQNSMPAAVEKVNSLDFLEVNPFTLLLADRLCSQTLSWNGCELTTELTIEDETETEPRWQFMSSSSIGSLRIPQQRLATFTAQQSREAPIASPAQELLSMHLHRNSGSLESSIFMDRKSTHTKSITQVCLQNGEIQFEYYSEDALESVRGGHRCLPVLSSSVSFSTLGVSEQR